MDNLLDYLNTPFAFFAMSIMTSYVLMAIVSRVTWSEYRNNNNPLHFKKLGESPIAPEVSVIAPAYNEGKNIIENIKSLVSLHYNQLEVIVVNDGSTDDTMEKVIREFDLVKTMYNSSDNPLSTKEVRAVYRSSNQLYRKLILVDKANGGKADALNAGINIAKSSLIACIDVDCILDPESIPKLVKPFLKDKKVIATGGVIRVINDSEINSGFLKKVHQSTNPLVRFQMLEYLRAFLLGRIAWGRINGLLLISGALGVFKRDLVINVGGYDTSTVGEDMELVVRMRKYMHEMKTPYRVAYIPDPLCWTEVPSDFNSLQRQRNRWMRGTIETLIKHRKLLFNPKYGITGMVSMPYWLIFEWLTPIVEVLGFVMALTFAILGVISWTYFLWISLFVYSFALMYSSMAMLGEEKLYFNYTKWSDILRMWVSACLEPVIYHPFVVIWSIRGNIDFLRGKKSWGKMSRSGF